MEKGSKRKKVTFHDEISFEGDGNPRTVTICRKIAEGGFSTLLLARDSRAVSPRRGRTRHHQHDHLYALKRIECNGDDDVDQCRKEAQVHQQINHENLIPLLGVKFGQNCCYMLFPYIRISLETDLVARRLLEDVLESKRRPYSEREALTLLAGIVGGLQALHNAGLSHRDVKPENVLLKESHLKGHHGVLRIPVLTDFGSVGPRTVPLQTRADVLRATEEAAQFTTLSHRAPELSPAGDMLAHGPSENLDYGRADIWSLGCLLFAMMYGMSPFEIEWKVSLIDEHWADGTARLRDYTEMLNLRGPVPFPPEGTVADQRYGNDMKDLVRWMLNQDRLERPNSAAVGERVERMLRTLGDWK